MSEALSVFVLAAGLGERLRPITSLIPKPLLPIVGRPVLEIILERISGLPAQAVGINLHYMAGEVGEWIKNRSLYGKNAELFYENPVLGTGGALKNARALLGRGTFLVHNSDILSDIDLARLIDAHRASGNLATLAVHDFPRFNTLALDARGMLLGVGKMSAGLVEEETKKRLAFTGIAVYEPEFLGFLPEGASGVVEAWLWAARTGHPIGTLNVSGCKWADIGSPQAYAASVIDAMRAEGETIYIHPAAEGCAGAALDGYVVVEGGCRLPEGVSLRNSIVLPGSAPEASFFENSIIGPGGLRLEFSEAEMLGAEDGLILIGTGGSDRKYFRRRDEKGSCVIVRYPPGEASREDFRRQMEYSRFFRGHGVPVAKLLWADDENLQAAFEDLGDISLYSWGRCRRAEADVEGLYREAVRIAALIHTRLAAHAASECPLLMERVFDYEHLRWETGYFLEHFVKGYRGVEPPNPPALDEEFHRLALRVDGFPKTAVHRDFQSQNIMVGREGTLGVVDFQGARIGPPAYDVASLLWDPYFRLEESMRERILGFYAEEMKRYGDGFFGESSFMESLVFCRLQRHMQALGAYGFLCRVKGKRHFAKHMDEAVRLLKEDVSFLAGEYPNLRLLVSGL